MKKIARFLIYFFISIVFLAGIGIAYIQLAFPKVSEAPNLQVSPTPQQLERGKYLAENVLNCIDCHSSRDMTVFAGPIIPGTEGIGGERFDEELGLPGTFYSKNITPHNLQNWSDGELYRLITSGVRKNGEPIFPFMPYQSYAQMDPEDTKAVIAYLRTLKPIKNDVPESKAAFPLNLIMRTFPKDPVPTKRPSSSDSVAYGKYLFTIAACSDCHTPMKDGQYEMDKYLSGGNDFPLPGNGIVRSLNITPDEETGIGSWSKKAFVERFKSPSMPHNQRQKVAKGEFNTLMPWSNYAKMTQEDLESIYSYLMTVKPLKNRVEKFTPEK